VCRGYIHASEDCGELRLHMSAFIAECYLERVPMYVDESRMLYLVCFVTVFLFAGPAVLGCLGNLPGEGHFFKIHLFGDAVCRGDIHASEDCGEFDS